MSFKYSPCSSLDARCLCQARTITDDLRFSFILATSLLAHSVTKLLETHYLPTRSVQVTIQYNLM